MAFLQIPDRFRDVLPLVSGLTEAQLSELEQALSSAPESPYSEDFSSITAKNISFLETKDSRLLIEALMALYLAKCNSNKSVQQVSADVHDNLFSAPHSEVKHKNIQSLDSTQFIEKLIRILSVPSFDLMAKATGLITENEKNYSESRVISDVRYIFSSGDNPQNVIGGVLVHKLKIDYFENSVQKEFFVSMDLKDLNELALTIQRAIAKDKILRKNFAEILFVE